MPISGFFTINASVQETLTTPENHSGSMFDIIRQSYQFSNGGGAGQNNLVWSDRRTLALNTTDTLDLNGGGLLDVFGAAVNFASVTGIMIFNRETVAGTRTLSFGPAPAATFLWTFAAAGNRTAIVPSSGYVQWTDAGVASPGGGDSIVIINTDLANAVIYDILIIGRV